MTTTLRCLGCDGLVIQLSTEPAPRICPNCRRAPGWEVKA